MKIALARRTERATAMLDNLASGLIRVYAGAIPANPEASVAGNTLLFTNTFSSTAATESGGVLTFNTITSGTAVAAGTMAFARIFQSDGTTVVADLSVGTSGADINFLTLTTVIGGTYPITSMTWTEPLGTTP